MEDEEGYMAIDPARRSVYTLPPAPQKTEGSVSKVWKIGVTLFLTGSLALNVVLIVLLIVFQIENVQNGPNAPASSNSCEWIPGKTIAHVTLDPETAHRRLMVSKDGKTVQWGKEEQNLPNNTERFDQRVWVLGKPGFNSGRHCWEVELKGNGEWAVGVAKQSLRRKGAVDFSTTEGLWAVAEYWGKGNYVAFTAPQPTPLSLGKKPQRIRVFLDYSERLVDFFNPDTKTTIYTFSSANFSGQTIQPWFRVWEGTELVLRP
nr:vespryn-21-like [Pogona vitticeps]XP_020633582.1 vespryn-21-like [Pogona vitticeps]